MSDDPAALAQERPELPPAMGGVLVVTATAEVIRGEPQPDDEEQQQ